MGRLLALVLVLLFGCLPKSSLSRRDELEAAVYTLALDVAVVTEGAAVEPFGWALEGKIEWSYARTFRDGSMGHLVRLYDLRGRVSRGERVTQAPVGLEGALLELRSFPDGEVLLVSGIAPYVGDAGHLEVLDVLWPALSPHLPGSREEAEKHTTSWPSWVAGGPKVRNRLVARWTRAGDVWSYAGALSSEGGYVRGQGDAEGEVALGGGGGRVRAHHFAWERATTTRWPGGALVTQTYVVRGRIAYVGTAPSPALALPVGADDPVADAMPVRLVDGREVRDPPVDLAATTPFLLLPDDLGDEERRAVRAAMGVAW